MPLLVRRAPPESVLLVPGTGTVLPAAAGQRALLVTVS